MKNIQPFFRWTRVKIRGMMDTGYTSPWGGNHRSRFHATMDSCSRIGTVYHPQGWCASTARDWSATLPADGRFRFTHCFSPIRNWVAQCHLRIVILGLLVNTCTFSSSENIFSKLHNTVAPFSISHIQQPTNHCSVRYDEGREPVCISFNCPTADWIDNFVQFSSWP